MGPVVAPVGTVAVMLVAELAVAVVEVPLNLTVLLAGVALKFVPVIVTVAPTRPFVGLKPDMVGPDELTVKLPELVPVRPLTVTAIGPVVAPVGTEVVMLVALLAVTVATVPLNLTVLFAGVMSKFVPVIVTDVPTTPLVGLKLAMVGALVVSVLRKIEMLFETLFGTARSGIPSPSRSPMATQ